MIYYISHCCIYGGGVEILEGPEDYDVEKEFKKWKSKIEATCGPEPNIVCYGSHTKWLLTYMLTLREYQNEYQCNGDFPTLFIEHLIKYCGFNRIVYRAAHLK